METSEPKTFTDLSLDKLKIMFADRLSPRRLACVEEKYDLLKYLWKELKIEDCYLEKYKINNQDEVSRHDDAFSRHLLEFRTYTGCNEYGKLRCPTSYQSINRVNLYKRNDNTWRYISSDNKSDFIPIAKQRLADRIEPIPQVTARSKEQISVSQFGR